MPRKKNEIEKVEELIKEQDKKIEVSDELKEKVRDLDSKTVNEDAEKILEEALGEEIKNEVNELFGPNGAHEFEKVIEESVEETIKDMEKDIKDLKKTVEEVKEDIEEETKKTKKKKLRNGLVQTKKEGKKERSDKFVSYLEKILPSHSGVINKTAERARTRGLTDGPLQFHTYELKLREAYCFLENMDDKHNDINDYPFIQLEAELRDLTYKEVAEMFIKSAETLKNRLIAIEKIRVAGLIALKECASLDELLKIKNDTIKSLMSI
jgi:hypothetical protein